MTPLIDKFRTLPRLHRLAAGSIALASLAALAFWPAPAPRTALPETGAAISTPHEAIATSTERIPLPAQTTNLLTDTPPEASIHTVTPVPERIENWVEYPVKSGDNLTRLFKRAGLGPREVYRISQATTGQNAFHHLCPGQTFAFLIEDGVLRKLRHVRTPLESTLVELTDLGYQARDIVRQPQARQRYAEGQIQSSLFADASAAGLPQRTIMQLAEIFGWDIDFALDLRAGDSFRVLYEQDYLDDKPLDRSRILAAEFINQGIRHQAVRFTGPNGDSDYFSPDGRSMRKAFLRSPVDFRRISSRFKPERYHPVLGKRRPHRGVDYAAATGTPIRAAGDGKIIWRGTKGGYGRTLMLQHGSNMTTLYAHMSRYQKGQHKGDKVKQGEIIGYVGASGLATGPHLHYEFRIDNVHQNPLTVDLPAAEPVPGPQREAFATQARTLLAALDAASGTRLAMTEQENRDE
ncbi:OapA family protein [Marinobacterium weihaiense]|uniref:Peptidoglycan DD-metalloendopeptidase family protein n=1 Tax=Marinobacterium weihaiense TaxID=2851016 RepID=A0ABS6MD22_9GAMM|nr:peptidoglycan DD-metalloendopeptidase family protein [Marinobacterium weihaiense]MBV0934193.1 peptidoglycan DD-metalloendopeptidase family protein [Marinobacterium weihaiense]